MATIRITLFAALLSFITTTTACAENHFKLLSITNSRPTNTHVVPDILGAKIDGLNLIIEERKKLYESNGHFTETNKFQKISCSYDQLKMLYVHWDFTGTTYVEIDDGRYPNSTWFTIEGHRKK